MTDLVPLAMFADVTLGKMVQPSKKNDGEQYRPYLRAAHVQANGKLDLSVEPKKMWFSTNEQRTYELLAGDVLVVEGGAVGRSAYLPRDLPGLGFQNALLRLRPIDGADGRYLDYCLQSAVARGEINALCASVSIAHFTAEKVGRFRIPDCPSFLQRVIADYLDRETGKIDAMIAKLDQLAENLEVREEAVSAAQLLPFGVPGDPTSTDDTIALGYQEVLPMKVLVTHRKERNLDQNAQYLSLVKGIGVIRYEDKGAVGNKKPTDLTRCINVRAGDYVLNSMNFYIGSYGLSGLDGVCSSVYLVFTPDSAMIEPNFLKHLFSNTELRQRVQDLGNGILEHRKSIPWDRFAAVKVPVPKLEAQRKVVADLDSSKAKIDAMLAKVAELKSLLIERRAALITDVVTGRKKKVA